MKRALATGVIVVLILVCGLKYLIFGFYMLKGEGVKHSLEMGEHGTRLAFSNLKHLPLYFREFFDKPRLEPHKIQPVFFGLNIAPPENETDDELVVSDLRLLGVKSLRVDIGFGYDLPFSRIDDFIEAVLPEFDVLIHVVQHPDMAASMNSPVFHAQWREFLRKIMARYQGRIEGIEIGSLPNRKKWSGYTIPDYLEAVKIAFTLSEEYGVDIAGPNIQDFEPFWQIAIFESLKQDGFRFSASTDNLFVDRAVQPELFDTHVLGEKLADVARMDLINKSRVLSSISKEFGIDSFFSTYTQWNLKVPSSYYFASGERLADPESYADYLVRYYLLAAAGGYIDRIYWGEYASYKEGLLDDAYNPAEEDRPFPDAHHKFLGVGDVGSYKKRSAFFAYRTMVNFLAGSRFIERVEAGNEMFVLRFEKGKRRILVLWSLDKTRHKFIMDDFELCRRFERDGNLSGMSTGPFIEVSESPQYLVCD